MDTVGWGDGIRRFFHLERAHADWRFWIVWVIVTIIGFFSGLALSRTAGSQFEIQLIQTVVSEVNIGLGADLAQGLVLQRHQIVASSF